MDPRQSIDENPMRAAHAAPRCEHIRRNGQRCAAPALRGQTHCHFHKSIQDRALYQEDGEKYLPFVEDATSLQFALMRVMRLLLADSFEHRRCSMLLYALQIASMNLKAFLAENPRPAPAEAEAPRPQSADGQRKKKTNGESDDEPGSLAELLLGFLAQTEGDADAPQPPIRRREDYYDAVAQRNRPQAALPDQATTG